MDNKLENIFNLSDFFKDEYVDQASYDNLRKIASVMDGLKNSGRKVIYTVLEENITQNQKLTQLSNKCAEKTEYLHGSLDGVVVNLTREYPGTNNLALLQGKGNFGTRFSQEASAPRYIFARKKEYTDKLFLKEDSLIVPEQYFEGSKIEPRFYVPTLPVLLINGSIGVSSGFAQTILPRDTQEIKKYLIKTLEGSKPRKFPMPSFIGFKGQVKQGDTHRQFIMEGVVKRLGANRVQVTEVPIHYDLQGYLKVLDKLEEDKEIQGYVDKSDDDKFTFEIRIPSKTLASLSESELLSFLKLTRAVSENYTSMTHENSIKEYESPEDILTDYILVKLEYTEKRKINILTNLAQKMRTLQSRFTFIQAVVNDELILAKRKKADIVKDISTLDVQEDGSGLTRFDYLLRMPVSALTDEELNKLNSEIKAIQKEIKDLSSKKAKDIWLEDIKNLKI